MNMHVFRSRRAELEQRIAEMIDLLDEIDGDADLEPSIGWPEAHGLSQVADISLHDDREDESELLEDGGDVEPNGDEADNDWDDDEFCGRYA